MKHSFARLKCIEQNERQIFNAMLEACHSCGLSVISSHKHEFWPYGFTAVIIVGESHFAVHTYPENNLLYADCFSCGEIEPNAVLSSFADKAEASVQEIRTVSR